MGKALILIILVGGICASALIFLGHEPKAGPAICVEVRTPTGGGGNYLPAVDGYLSRGSTSGSAGAHYWQARSSYRVVASSPGHFFVLAHYQIDQDGQRAQVDQALPVYAQKPDASLYTPIKGDLAAYAYMSNTTLTY